MQKCPTAAGRSVLLVRPLIIKDWMRLLVRPGRQKSGALAWEQEPRVARFHLSVSFSHRRVGSSILASLSEARWERTLKSNEQAPSPSLTTRLDSSSETRQRFRILHETHHDRSRR